MNEISLTPAHRQLRQLLARRVAILDGAMGTMIQQFKFSEADYRGMQFSAFHRDLKGNGEMFDIFLGAPGEAPARMQALGIDYVAFCPGAPERYFVSVPYASGRRVLRNGNSSSQSRR